MPPTFPFFRFPVLIQFQVLKHLGLLELFYLSLISKRSKHIVKSLNLKLSRVFWNLSSRRECTVQLIHPNCTRLYLCFHTVHMIRTPFKRINVNGVVVPVAERNGSRAFLTIQTISVEERWEVMDEFTEHFLELFKVSKYAVRLPNVPNLRSWFLWKYTTRFEIVEVRNWLDGRPSRQLTSDEVKFVLEELTVDELNIEASVDKEIRYSGPLKMKELWVKNEDWLTLEAILNMDCEKLYFGFTTFTYQNLNAIIKKWLTGGLKNLEHLGLFFAHHLLSDSRNTKLECILEGIEHFPWDANKIVDFGGNRYIRNFRDGRDIRRSDGTIATVDVANNYFVFYIWNHLSE